MPLPQRSCVPVLCFTFHGVCAPLVTVFLSALSWCLCVTCNGVFVPYVMVFVSQLSWCLCPNCHGVFVPTVMVFVFHMSWCLCPTCHGVCVPHVMVFVSHLSWCLCASLMEFVCHLPWRFVCTCHGHLSVADCSSRAFVRLPTKPSQLPHASRDVRGKHILEPNVRDRHPASSKSLSHLANPRLSSNRRCSGR